jgi:hypothetical protein
MATNRKLTASSGYARSDAATFVIPNTATGSAVAAIDLGRNYGFIVVKCADATGVASGTLSAEVGYDDSDTLCTLYTEDMAAKWASMTLPTTGSFSFVLRAALGIQRIRFILSAAADADLTLTVYGFDAGKDA